MMLFVLRPCKMEDDSSLYVIEIFGYDVTING